MGFKKNRLDRMQVEVDRNSGFCFGVKNAIEKAEAYLKNNKKLYCLGEIVHNQVEVERLEKMGLQTIDYETFQKLENCTVLLRAHGEPPETYEIAAERNIQLIDATCPVVLQLQKKVANCFMETNREGRQILLYGKKGHAEVIGLAGQTRDKAIVISDEADLEKVDFAKPIAIYSQTTKSITGFKHIVACIEKRISNLGLDPAKHFVIHNSICGQVSGRDKELKKFARQHDAIVFVSGKNSSNGKMLYQACKQENEQTFFISTTKELDELWFQDSETVGVCGATSTPMWLMEEVAEEIRNFKI